MAEKAGSRGLRGGSSCGRRLLAVGMLDSATRQTRNGQTYQKDLNWRSKGQVAYRRARLLFLGPDRDQDRVAFPCLGLVPDLDQVYLLSEGKGPGLAQVADLFQLHQMVDNSGYSPGRRIDLRVVAVGVPFRVRRSHSRHHNHHIVVVGVAAGEGHLHSPLRSHHRLRREQVSVPLAQHIAVAALGRSQGRRP